MLKDILMRMLFYLSLMFIYLLPMTGYGNMKRRQTQGHFLICKGFGNRILDTLKMDCKVRVHKSGCSESGIKRDFRKGHNFTAFLLKKLPNRVIASLYDVSFGILDAPVRNMFLKLCEAFNMGHWGKCNPSYDGNCIFNGSFISIILLLG